MLSRSLIGHDHGEPILEDDGSLTDVATATVANDIPDVRVPPLPDGKTVLDIELQSSVDKVFDMMFSNSQFYHDFQVIYSSCRLIRAILYKSLHAYKSLFLGPIFFI